MKLIIIDNVNNLSGAPTVARDISLALNAPIYCIREEVQRSYVSAISGVHSESVFCYPLGILLLATNIRFVLALLKADVVVCNTSLTFLFAALARCLGKRTICVIHESSAKNLLYRIAIPASLVVASEVVTPSRNAFLSLQIPIKKWTIIYNSISLNYKEEPFEKVRSDSDHLYILFVDDGRTYKGGALFREIVHLAASRVLTNLVFHSTRSERFKQDVAEKPRLGPAIYSKYHFLLVLTDNTYWRETFGLVGCEAAACECVPLYTDQFAYREIWHKFDETLFLQDRNPANILERIMSLASNPTELSTIRESVRQRALEVSSDVSFDKRWRDFIAKTL
jgi:glycosyltransferase involved in cell wall biosynthesis